MLRTVFPFPQFINAMFEKLRTILLPLFGFLLETTFEGATLYLQEDDLQ